MGDSDIPVWVYPTPRYDDGLGPEKEKGGKDEGIYICRLTKLLNTKREPRPAHLADVPEDVLTTGYRALHSLQAQALYERVLAKLPRNPGTSNGVHLAREHLFLGDRDTRVIYYVFPTVEDIPDSNEKALNDFDDATIIHMTKEILVEVKKERESNGNQWFIANVVKQHFSRLPSITTRENFAKKLRIRCVKLSTVCTRQDSCH